MLNMFHNTEFHNHQLDLNKMSYTDKENDPVEGLNIDNRPNG
jgi:hypothetical protein